MQRIRLAMLAVGSNIIENERLTGRQFEFYMDTLGDLTGLPDFYTIEQWAKQLTGKSYRTIPAKTQLASGEYYYYPTYDRATLIRKVDLLNKLLYSHPDPYRALAVAHYELTDAHPFEDGNGRTLRMVLTAWCIVLDISAPLIAHWNKDEYLDYLQNHDIAGLTWFFKENRI